MTDLNLQELKQIATNATQGEWDCEYDEVEGTVEVNAGTARTQWDEQHDGLRIGRPAPSYASRDKIFEREDLWDEELDAVLNNAEHIAAFDPPTALALIARIEELEATIQRVDDLHQEDLFRGHLSNGCKSCECDYYPCPTIQALGDPK